MYCECKYLGWGGLSNFVSVCPAGILPPETACDPHALLRIRAEKVKTVWYIDITVFGHWWGKFPFMVA